MSDGAIGESGLCARVIELPSLELYYYKGFALRDRERVLRRRSLLIDVKVPAKNTYSSGRDRWRK